MTKRTPAVPMFRPLTILFSIACVLVFPVVANAVVPTTEASRYIGEWSISFEFQGNPVTMSLRFIDADGSLNAHLRSPADPQPTVITNISTVSRGLKLEYAQAFGESEIAMTMIVRLERGDLHGSISAEGGVFTAEISGDKSGKIPGRTTLQIEGNEIKITYGPLPTDKEDYVRFNEVQDGEVFEFVRSRATKLFTDADLLFGETRIQTENAGPDYPGVYSLWLKRVGNGWNLVFNEEADVWGTQHDPSKDVAEIPLTMGTAKEEEHRFIVELVQGQDNAGVLRLAWGTTEWTTNLRLAQ